MTTFRPSSTHRDGFTLVELLVVIAIIEILLGLSLPAIQHVREAGRRVECQSNLRQIAFGLQHFHDEFGHFPPAHKQHPTNIMQNYNQPWPYGDESYYFAWSARIIPFLERNNLWDQADLNAWAFANPPKGLGGVSGDYINAKRIAMYECPSFPGNTAPYSVKHPVEGLLTFAHTDYLGVNGTDQFSYDGILHVNSRVRMTDVKDGTSNTFLIGARPRPHDRYFGWWFADAGVYPWFGAAGAVLGTEERIAVSGESTPDGPTSYFQPGHFRYESDGFDYEKHAWHFWSAHSGGAFFAFADGHVKFVNYSTGRSAFRRLGTYRGGEATDG